jgi:CheY-like chemotaxis protein
MNTLVVDKNESVADSLGFLLDCCGHRTVVAYDGETALTLLRSRVLELVLLDENLPGMTTPRIVRRTGKKLGWET